MATHLLLACTVGLLLVGLIRYIHNRRVFQQKYRLPPQVPGLPFFGNTFQIPKVNPGAWAREQANKYGELFTCKIGSNTFVFLNSSRVVKDLLEKRAGVYSGRQKSPMAFDLILDGNSSLLMQYGPGWRIRRKAVHSILKSTNLHSFMPRQDLESKQYLFDILHHPEQWHTAGKTYSNSVIMSMVFGKRARSNDPHVEPMWSLIEALEVALLPGAWLVDSYPILDRLPRPLKWWLSAGLKVQNTAKRLYGSLMQEALDKEARGEGQDCFALQIMKNEDMKDLGWDAECFLAGDLIQAGTDTTYGTSSVILAAAAKYPNWVARARDELDSVCGHKAERLPTFDDRPNLPYITAVVKEALRWRPIFQIGLGHMLTRDDEYEGYRFPAGTLFTWNAWAISFSPDEYEDPEAFKPERFLNDDLEHPLKGHFGFGAGRRVCAGFNVGQNNVWILAARFLYCFDFSEDPDDPIDTVLGTDPVVAQETKRAPFSLKIKPRSPRHAALIERLASEESLTLD